MDTNIFDGMITPRIQKGMTSIDRKKTELSDPITLASPTLVAEIRDLDRILQKSSGRETRIISQLVHYPSLVDPELIATIEYDLKPPPKDDA